MRRIWVLALFGAVVLVPVSSLAASAGTPPRLAVVVVVDGLSWDELATFRPWFTSGLKAVLDEGMVYTQCRYRHLNADTASGNASLATGAPPSIHGIVSDRWFEPGPGGIRDVGATDQPWAPAPGSPPLFYREVKRDGVVYVFAIQYELDQWAKDKRWSGWARRERYGDNGETVVFDSRDARDLFNVRHGRPAEPFPQGTMPGPAHLRVQTVGDRLLQEKPGSRVVSIAGADTPGVLLAGKSRSHIVYWFDRESGKFTTSGAYDLVSGPGEDIRKLVKKFNETHAGRSLTQRLGTVWRRLPTPDKGLGEDVPRPLADLADFQVPTVGLGFDHDVSRHADGVFAGVAVSPFVDEAVSELAERLLADDAVALGRGSVPDMLAVSFSGYGEVAAAYGPGSEEALDALRRIDLHLGRLLAVVSERVGKGEAVVALASDHGTTPIPEAARLRNKDAAGGRLVVGPRTFTDFVARLNLMLAGELCVETRVAPVLGASGWTLTYNLAALPLQTNCLACPDHLATSGVPEIDRAVRSVASRFFSPEIQEIIPAAQLTADAPVPPPGRPFAGPRPNDAMVAFARNDHDRERSGQAFVIGRENVVMSRDPGRGTSCGSPWEPDIHVPLVLWGGRMGQGVSDQPVAPYDLAPTLAALLGVHLPDATGTRLPQGK
ncbi:MAG: hypothetical protein EPN53_03855 [Acidobacteria bacterium]|nr:MAG: hypothetical protein EPN53_03855 [Acidobacteriota bacterium]